MVKKYVADTGFYAEQDRLVSLARAIQHESHHGDIDLREERAQPAQSHYGKALELGTGYIVATSDFLSGEIGSEQLSTAFHIGVKGRDGKSV
jgi:hypothetical protein